MSKVSPIYINALLADAAYIDLPMGELESDPNSFNKLSKRMTYSDRKSVV